MTDDDPRPDATAPDRAPLRDARTGASAAAQRMAHQHQYVDEQIRLAMRRGDFDDLPGAGEPLDLGAPNDPDWWLKKLIERERITGVLPAALQLRKDDAELDARLDRVGTEREVREVVDEFNRRVVEARRQLTGGPPVITPTRDVDDEVAAWRRRREERRTRREAEVERPPGAAPEGGASHRALRRRRWRRPRGSSQT